MSQQSNNHLGVRLGLVSDRSSQLFICGPAGTAEVLGPAPRQAGEYWAQIQFTPEHGDCEQGYVRGADRGDILTCVCRAVAGDNLVGYGMLLFNALVMLEDLDEAGA